MAWAIDMWQLEVEGLCNLKLPREAHFRVFSTAICFRAYSKEGFFDFFSFQGKNWINPVLSFRFELCNHFTRFFLEGFEFILDTV